MDTHDDRHHNNDLLYPPFGERDAAGNRMDFKTKEYLARYSSEQQAANGRETFLERQDAAKARAVKNSKDFVEVVWMLEELQPIQQLKFLSGVDFAYSLRMQDRQEDVPESTSNPTLRDFWLFYSTDENSTQHSSSWLPVRHLAFLEDDFNRMPSEPVSSWQSRTGSSESEVLQAGNLGSVQATIVNGIIQEEVYTMNYSFGTDENGNPTEGSRFHTLGEPPSRHSGEQWGQRVSVPDGVGLIQLQFDPVIARAFKIMVFQDPKDPPLVVDSLEILAGCNVHNTGQLCVCDAIHVGDNCEFECPGVVGGDISSQMPCSGHGVCHADGDAAVCACDIGWIGDGCDWECPGQRRSNGSSGSIWPIQADWNSRTASSYRHQYYGIERWRDRQTPCMMRGVCQLKFQGSQCQFDIPLQYRQFCTPQDPIPSDCTGIHEAEVQNETLGSMIKTIVTTDARVFLLGSDARTNYSGFGYIDIPDNPREYFVMWSFVRCQSGNLTFSMRYATPFDTTAILIVNGDQKDPAVLKLNQTDSWTSFRAIRLNISVDFPSPLTVKIVVIGGVKAPNIDYLQVSSPNELPE
jgi:hypothetical protein